MINLIVYLDLVLIIDFALTFVFLKLTNYLLHSKVKTYKILLSSLISSILVFAYLFDYYIYLIIKIAGGVLIVSIGLKTKDVKKNIVSVIIYYLINFSFIGILSSYKISDLILTALSLIVVISLFIIEARKKEIININSKTYDVLIDNGNLVKLKGFMDTGNDSRYKGVPIIYLDNSFMNDDFKLAGYQVIETVNGATLHNLYRAKSIYLNSVEINVYISFIDLDDNECLLNILLL